MYSYDNTKPAVLIFLAVGDDDGDCFNEVVVHGLRPPANVIDPRNEGREHLQPAFKVAHLAAGGLFFESLDRFLVMIEKECEAFLKGRFVQDGAHDMGHVKRVVALARRIGEEEGAEPAVVVPAAWLHDCVSVAKDSPDRSRASRLAADRAVRFLSGIGHPEEHMDAIHHAIECHSFSLGKSPESLEAKIVQDADRLDAIGAVGIARCFLTGGVMDSAMFHPEDPFGRERQLDDRAYAVDHFYLKLLTLKDTLHTDAARREAGRRHGFMLGFLDELATELGEISTWQVVLPVNS